MKTNAKLVLTIVITITLLAGCGGDDGPTGPETTTGTLEISIATTGDTPDSNGYTVTLDGDESRDVDPDGTVIFAGVPEGDHEVELSGVQVNCAPDGGAMQAVTVTAEETTTTGFDVTCEAALFDKIVFASVRLGDYGIFAMETDGSSPALVGGDVGVRDRWPDVSPNGTQISFVSNLTGNPDVFVMNADGTGVTRLTDDPAGDFASSWSPDGERIAFESERDGDFDIYVMNTDGTGVTRLTDDSATDGGPSWSSDGEYIAFHSDRDGNFDIYVMNTDGMGVTRLTDDPAGDFASSWSPDGERIAFESERNGNDDIYVMNADGTGIERLTNDPAYSDADPVWTPSRE